MYRTTLGHKVNHKFEGINAEFETVDHPVHGGIVCLVAATEIDVDDEIFAHYRYSVEQAAEWYREEYANVYGREQDEVAGMAADEDKALYNTY